MDAGERLREALAELEALWSEYDMFIREIAAPGVSEDEIRAELATVGLIPPPELIVWWGWHNGVTDDAPNSTAYTQIGVNGWSQVALRDAVQWVIEERETAADLASEPGSRFSPGFFWHDDWVPLLTVGGAEAFVMRCAEPQLGTLVVNDPELVHPPDQVEAPSLYELVSSAIHEIRSGSVPEDTLQLWQSRPGRL